MSCWSMLQLYPSYPLYNSRGEPRRIWRLLQTPGALAGLSLARTSSEATPPEAADCPPDPDPSVTAQDKLVANGPAAMPFRYEPFVDIWGAVPAIDGDMRALVHAELIAS